MHVDQTSSTVINSGFDEAAHKPNHSIKGNEQSESHLKVSFEHKFKLGCLCRMLAADLEGVKLDVTIMCRDIEDKFAAHN